MARRRAKEPQIKENAEYHAVVEATNNLSDDDAESEEAKSLSLRIAIELIREEFSEKNWNAFWRTIVDGLSATEVGEELGLSAQAVRKAKSRILARLRQEFGGLID